MKEENGLINQKLEASIPRLGYTNRETVMIDCDNMLFRVVKKLTLITMKRCKQFLKLNLGGFIILKSSFKHYHVVFNRLVSWEDNLSVLGWFSVLSHNPKVKDYLVMQAIKKAPTLRVAPTKDNPSPRIVYRFGFQGHAIKDFLRYRQLIKKIYYSIEGENKKND